MNFSVAKDFSKSPAGSVLADGKFSGEAFRNVLREVIHTNSHVTVDLDGTQGYGSGWLKEAFGGLVSHDIFDAPTLKQRLTFKATDTTLITEIWDYIDSAKKYKIMIVPNRELFDKVIALVYQDAEGAAMDAGMGGHHHDGGAGLLKAQAKFFEYGLKGKMPPEWEKYQQLLDPEYAEYIRLKKKFEK